MDAPKVLPIIDDYFLGADKYCLILYKRGEVSGDGYRKAKPENIGKETYTAIGYYRDLKSLAAGLSKRFLYEGVNNENVESISDLIKLMDDFLNRIGNIEEEYRKIMAEKMEGTDDSTSEDNEEE